MEQTRLQGPKFPPRLATEEKTGTDIERKPGQNPVT
jgi:hypothetical protein